MPDDDRVERRGESRGRDGGRVPQESWWPHGVHERDLKEVKKEPCLLPSGREFWAEGTASSKTRRLMGREGWRVTRRDGPQ